MGECLLVHMLIVVMQKPTKARKGHWSFWVTFVGQFRPIEMGAGNWTHVSCKYSKFSYLRSQLFIPYINIFFNFYRFAYQAMEFITVFYAQHICKL